jgi:hypothetical protein
LYQQQVPPLVERITFFWSLLILVSTMFIFATVKFLKILFFFFFSKKYLYLFV